MAPAGSTTDAPAPLTLASGSAIRRKILQAAGVEFEAVSPDVDEAAIKAARPGAAPEDLALELAEAKALAVSKNRDGLVIGADQVLVLDGAILDKAPDMAAARARLLAMRGKPHQLVGGCALARGPDIVWRSAQTSTIHVRDFSDAFLDAYIETAGPDILASVACYQFEGLGAQLFEKVEGDYFAILGLPLLPLLAALRTHGGLAA